MEGGEEGVVEARADGGESGAGVGEAGGGGGGGGGEVGADGEQDERADEDGQCEEEDEGEDGEQAGWRDDLALLADGEDGGGLQEEADRAWGSPDPARPPCSLPR